MAIGGEWASLGGALPGETIVPWGKDRLILYDAARPALLSRGLLRKDRRSRQWKPIRTEGDAPTPRRAPAVAVISDQLVVYGGLLLGGDLSSDLFVLPLSNGTLRVWLKVALTGSPRGLCGAQAYPSSQGLLLVGGMLSPSEPNLAFYTLPFESGQWARVSDTPDLPQAAGVVGPSVSVQEGHSSATLLVYGGAHPATGKPLRSLWRCTLKRSGTKGWHVSDYPVPPSPFVSFHRGALYCASFNTLWRLEEGAWCKIYSLELPLFTTNDFFAGLSDMQRGALASSAGCPGETPQQAEQVKAAFRSALSSHFAGVPVGGPVLAVACTPWGGGGVASPSHIFCFNVAKLACSFIPSSANLAVTPTPSEPAGPLPPYPDSSTAASPVAAKSRDRGPRRGAPRHRTTALSSNTERKPKAGSPGAVGLANTAPAAPAASTPRCLPLAPSPPPGGPLGGSGGGRRLPAVRRVVLREVLKTITHLEPCGVPSPQALSGITLGGGGVAYGGYCDATAGEEGVPTPNPKHELQRALHSVSGGVLDLTRCNATPEVMYILAMCVNFGDFGVAEVAFKPAAVFPAPCAKLLLSMVQMNRCITNLDFSEHAVQSASLSRLIREQLRCNVSLSAAAKEKAVLKQSRRELSRRLYHERQHREWLWERETQRIQIEIRFEVAAFLEEESMSREFVQITRLSGLSSIRNTEQLHLQELFRRLRASEELRSERLAFTLSEQPPRDEISRAEMRSWAILGQLRLDDRRSSEALFKERLRKERQLREDICSTEKVGRVVLKEDEAKTFKTTCGDFRKVLTKLDSEWKKKLQLERDEEKRVKEEHARVKREEEARLLRYERWRDQQRREQQAALRDENTARYTMGNEEQDQRRAIQAAAAESRMEYLKLEEEGVARRHLAELNFVPPKLVMGSVPSQPFCHISHSEITPTLPLSSIELQVHMPLPAHLEAGLSYACDTETSAEFHKRKTTPLNGRILVYVSSTYYHPTTSVSCFSDIEKDGDRLFVEAEENVIYHGHTERRRVGKILNVMKPRDIWRYEGHPADECPSSMEADESTYGLEILLEGVPLADYEKVLHNIGVRCEKLTPGNEPLALMIAIDVEFCAPLTRSMRPTLHPMASFVGNPAAPPGNPAPRRASGGGAAGDQPPLSQSIAAPGVSDCVMIETPVGPTDALPEDSSQTSSRKNSGEIAFGEAATFRAASIATLDLNSRVPAARRSTVGMRGRGSIAGTVHDLVFGQNLYEGATAEEKEYPIALTGGKVVAHVTANLNLDVLLGSFSAPIVSENFTYVEGDAPLHIFKGAVVEGIPEVIRLSILNYDADDLLGVKGGAIIKANNTVKAEGKEVAVVVSKDRHSIVIHPHETATPHQLTTLLESMTYENVSEDPDPEDRTVRLSFEHSTGINTYANMVINVVPEDDPTVVDWGCICLPFRRDDTQLIDSLQNVDSLPPFQDYLHFSATATVTDVDTEVFKTGLLIVRTQSYSRGDDILLVPPKGSPITRNGSTVYHKGVRLGMLGPVEDHPEGLSVTFAEADASSISKLNSLIKCFVFTTQSSREGLRVIEATLYIDEYNPVKATCQVRVTGPLVSVLPEHQTVLYREQSGPVPLGPYELPQLDDGWDGGFVHVELVAGATPDDSIRFSPTHGDLSEGEGEKDPGSPSDGKVGVSLKDKLKNHVKATSSVSGLSDKSNSMALLKKTQAIYRVLDMKQALQEEMRRRGVAAGKADVKEIRERGKIIGTYTLVGNGILIHTAVNLAVMNSDTASRCDTGRAELCSTKKSTIASILAQLVYTNTSENPKITRKVVSVTVNDGMPHSSRSLLEISIQPTNATNLLRRKGNDVLHYRQGQFGISGVPLFQDLTLHNPKKSLVYTGGYLAVEPVSGGDAVGDQLGFLTVQEQQTWYETDRRRLLADRLEREMEMKEAAIAKLKEPGVSAKPTSLQAKAAAVSKKAREGASKPKAGKAAPGGKGGGGKDLANAVPERRKLLALNPAERVYISAEEDGGLHTVNEAGEKVRRIGTLAFDEVTSAIHIGFDTSSEVSSDLAEACLWCLSYSNSSSKAKHSTIIYQLRAKPPDCATDARSKMTLKVHPPFLWAPEYSKSLTYTEGDSWTVVNTKLAANIPHYPEGLLEVCVTAEPDGTGDGGNLTDEAGWGGGSPLLQQQQPSDDIRWGFSDSDFHLRGDSLFKGKDLIATVPPLPKEPRAEALLQAAVPAAAVPATQPAASPFDAAEAGGLTVDPAGGETAQSQAVSKEGSETQSQNPQSPGSPGAASSDAATAPPLAFGRTATSVIPNSSVLRFEFSPGLKMTSKALTALLKCVQFRGFNPNANEKPGQGVGNKPDAGTSAAAGGVAGTPSAPDSPPAAPEQLPVNRFIMVEMKFSDAQSGASTTLSTTVFKKRRDEVSSQISLNLKKQPVSYVLCTGPLNLCPAAGVVFAKEGSSENQVGAAAACGLISVSVATPLPGDSVELFTADGRILASPETGEVRNTVSNQVLGTMSRKSDTVLDVVLVSGVTQRQVESILRSVCYSNPTMRQRNSKRCVSLRLDSSEAKIIQLELLPASIDFCLNTSIKFTHSKKKLLPTLLLPSVKINIKDIPDATLMLYTTSPLTFSLLPVAGLHLRLHASAEPAAKELKVEGGFSRASKGKIMEANEDGASVPTTPPPEDLQLQQQPVVELQISDVAAEAPAALPAAGQDNLMAVVADGKNPVASWEVFTEPRTPELRTPEASQEGHPDAVAAVGGQASTEGGGEAAEPVEPPRPPPLPKSQTLVVKTPDAHSKVATGEHFLRIVKSIAVTPLVSPLPKGLHKVQVKLVTKDRTQIYTVSVAAYVWLVLPLRHNPA